MSALWSDLQFAVRMLMKAPGFSLAVIGALALGIGPNTAIFSVVYATLLAPLPFPNPEQIVLVWSKVRGNRDATSPADYLAWKKQATSFQYLEPFVPRGLNLATPEAPERIRARQVSPDGHRMFGEDVWLGRDFASDEDQPGKNKVVLLKHRLWRERFGADSGIIGRDIRMDGVPYKVIGILHPGARDRLPADLWIPLTLKPSEIENRQFRSLLITGRLKAGVTMEQAQQEMNVISERLAQQYPESNKGRTVSVEPLQNNFLGAEVVSGLWLLLAAVSFVVLIACVNVANMLLSRGAVREREIAIRAALGATRERLVRMALTESVLLALCGGALGAFSSIWILQGILAMVPRFTLPAEADPQVNLPVLMFTFAAALFAGLLCGAAHAWRAGRQNFVESLKLAGRSMTGMGRGKLGHVLVTAEFGMAVTLLSGAGLAIQSFWNRTQVDLGVRTDDVLTFALPVNEGRFANSEEIDQFYRQLVERLESVPGVTHASVSAPSIPLRGGGFARQFNIVGDAVDTPSSRASTGVQMVTAGYFGTFGIRMVQGRPLTEQDRAGTERVAVVNERFAKRFLAGRDPLSERIAMRAFAAGDPRQGFGPGAPGGQVEWRIVGVFHDVSNLEKFGDPTAPQICIPFSQSPGLQSTVAVRTAVNVEGVRKSVSAEVRKMAPDLPMADVLTMEQIMGERLASDQMNMALYGGLAVLALVLAALGIYSVMSYTVTQRSAEIGLRMALGAGQSEVRGEILREGMTLAARGLVLGLAGAYGLGRAMQSILYGTGALSVPVLLGVGAVLLGAAMVACYVPARRASGVDPMTALRSQ